MVRQSIATPVGLLIITLSVVALLLFSPGANPQAAPLEQECGNAPYPACTATAQTGSTPTTSSASATPAASATGVTNTASATSASATATGATSTGATATVAPSATQAVTNEPAATLPPPTPVDGALACIPGTTVFMQGRGPATTAILIYFADQPVGGGTTDSDGHFKIALKIGAERYGVYEVQARVRSSQRVVAKEVCVVPYLSPTPTPLRRSPP